jgi:hypothetical protein
MKAFRLIAIVLFLAVAACALLADFLGMVAKTPTLPDSGPLPPGQINPPTERIGQTWPIDNGAKVWIYTNTLEIGKVLSCDDAHEFQDGTIQQAVELKPPHSPALWVPRAKVRKAWIEKRSSSKE